MSAVEFFDAFLAAQTVTGCLQKFQQLCDVIGVDPDGQPFPSFFANLKKSLLAKPAVSHHHHHHQNNNQAPVRQNRGHNNNNWKAASILHKLHHRASNTSSYGHGNNILKDHQVLVIGGGPVGLRAAIELQLLGAHRVTVIEKRDTFSRCNVIRLWPCVIEDLKSLGAKKIYGRFCAGSIDHVSIRQLQLILLKVALLCGVRVVVNAKFERLCPRSLLTSSASSADSNCDCRCDVGFAKAHFSGPNAHLLEDFRFTILIGADGRRNSLSRDFPRKEFRGRLAIAITANFQNTRSVGEARVEEISGTSYIYNQQWFKDLQADTGIELENFTYYKDETHFVVMTATKNSLLQRGVLLQDQDSNALLSPDNIDRAALLQYTRDATEWTTGLRQPFILNHNGVEDVQIFDFTSMYSAENACKVKRLLCAAEDDDQNKYLLMCLVGDALLEPFWPIGSGLGRGFLSSFDAAWTCREWVIKGHQDESKVLSVLAQRESIYKILSQTTAENVSKSNWTLNPKSRYTNLNNTVTPDQVLHLLYENLRKPQPLSVAEKRARRATVAVTGADLNRSSSSYEIRPRQEWANNRLNQERLNQPPQRQLQQKLQYNELLHCRTADRLHKFEHKNGSDNSKDPTSSTGYQNQLRNKQDWLVGKVDHEKIGKIIMNQPNQEIGPQIQIGIPKNDDSRFKSRIKDLEYKLQKSRGLLNEDKQSSLLKINDIPERAAQLQKIFDDVKKPTPSKAANTKVGRIEPEDWNVKVWSKRAKVPSPPPLINRPEPRPERNIEIFQSKVTKAAEMLQNLDPDVIASTKKEKAAPTRDWVAQLQSEIVSKQQPKTESRPYEPPPPSPTPVYRRQKSKPDPVEEDTTEVERKSSRKFDRQPSVVQDFLFVKNPLTTSQSESHIQPRPECARCHEAIINIWERIVVNGLMLHRSCLLCSVCRVQLRISEVVNTKNFTCVVCSANNNNQTSTSLHGALRAKQQWISTIDKVDLRGQKPVDGSQKNQDVDVVDQPANISVGDSSSESGSLELSDEESDDETSTTTSFTTSDDDEDGDDEDEDDDDNELDESEEIELNDTGSDVTWDSESDSDSDSDEEAPVNGCCSPQPVITVSPASLCTSSATNPSTNPTNETNPSCDPSMTTPMTSPPQPLGEQLQGPLRLSSLAPSLTLTPSSLMSSSMTESSNTQNQSNTQTLIVPKIVKSSIPRLSYTGSFTEKLLQRSHSQPSLIRGRPTLHPIGPKRLANEQLESSDFQFADANSPSLATFSPVKRLTQLAPVITLEDV